MDDRAEYAEVARAMFFSDPRISSRFSARGLPLRFFSFVSNEPSDTSSQVELVLTVSKRLALALGAKHFALAQKRSDQFPVFQLSRQNFEQRLGEFLKPLARLRRARRGRRVIQKFSGSRLRDGKASEFENRASRSLDTRPSLVTRFALLGKSDFQASHPSLGSHRGLLKRTAGSRGA